MAVVDWIRGGIFCLLWYSSICSGFLALCCPLLPLLIMSPTTYRYGIDAIFAMWELYPVALMRLLFGTRVLVRGTPLRSGERSLVVMNHRTRLDWNFLWSAAYEAARPRAHRLKFVLKAPIRHVPGAGWVMQMACFLYIYRNWQKDRPLLEDAIRHFSNLDLTCQILLFPEGTDLTAGSKEKSDRYAASHGLPSYQHVLHPKTTGFAFLAETMRQYGGLDAVYDITVAYPCTLPQSEMDLLRGRFPEEIHFHITRHDASALPVQESALKGWLEARWREKETTLQEFYAKGKFSGEFVSDGGNAANSVPLDAALCLALIFWTCLVIGVAGLLWFSSLARLYSVVLGSVFVALSLTGGGAHRVELAVGRWWKRYECRVKEHSQ